MREAAIYTATSVRGRFPKDGWIGYTLEYYPEGKKYSRTLTDYEEVSGVNENRAELESLIRALSRFREKCSLTIYTDSRYIYQALGEPHYIEQWIKSGWRSHKGQEIKNRDEWQRLIQLLQGNQYMLELQQCNAYTGALLCEVKRREKTSCLKNSENLTAQTR